MSFKAFSLIILVAPLCYGQISTGKVVTQVSWNWLHTCWEYSLAHTKKFVAFPIKIFPLEIITELQKFRSQGIYFSEKDKTLGFKTEKASYKFKHKVVTSG